MKRSAPTVSPDRTSWTEGPDSANCKGLLLIRKDYARARTNVTE